MAGFGGANEVSVGEKVPSPAFQIMEGLEANSERRAKRGRREEWQVSEELTKLAWEKKSHRPLFEFMKHLSGKMPDLLTNNELG